MTTRRLVAYGIAGALAAGPGAALAQSSDEPALSINAFSNKNGPTVTFRENPARSEGAAPTLRKMEIGRPSRVSVSAPPSGRALGTLSYRVGASTQSANAVERKVDLRRTALGNGRYELASDRGARVVLSTRSRSAFLSITLPSSAHSITLSLRGAGARLLDVRGSCASQAFTARFVTSTGTVVRGSSTVSARSLRSAGLC